VVRAINSTWTTFINQPHTALALKFLKEVVNSGWATGHPVTACREGKSLLFQEKNRWFLEMGDCSTPSMCFSPLNLKSVPNDRKTLGFRDGP